MPIPVEAIQSYLMRAGLKFASNDDGDNGQFMLSFKTRSYQNPIGEKSLTLFITVAEDGKYLEIAAVGMYSGKKAKDIGKLSLFLLGENYKTKLLRWELDRTDNEVRATIEVAPVDGCITFDAFMRMLMLFPLVADGMHAAITKVMTTAKLPTPTRIDKRLQELVRRAGGVRGLERLVRAHEKTKQAVITIDPEVARKFGLETDASANPSSSDASNPVPPSPAPPIPDSPEAPPHDPVGESPRPDDDDGPCSCDSPARGE